MKIRPEPFVIAIACAVVAAAAPVSAATIVSYDASTLGGPVWDRPDTGGSAVSPVGSGTTFFSQPFSVAEDGAYSFRGRHGNPAGQQPGATWGGVTFLYEGGFNSTQPLDNFVVADLGSGGAGATEIDDVPLTAGQKYHLVTTGFDSRQAGIFTNDIFGPGDIFLSKRNFTYDATTLGGERWHKPVPSGTQLSPTATNAIYHVQEFSVSETELYDVLGFADWQENQWGLAMFLYSAAFDPADPLANFVIREQDLPASGISGFTGVPLDQGEPYFLVTSGRDNTEAGDFTNIVTGPGTVTFGATETPDPPFKPEPELPPPSVIPVPASLPLLLAALAGLGLAARRRG